MTPPLSFVNFWTILKKVCFFFLPSSIAWKKAWSEYSKRKFSSFLLFCQKLRCLHEKKKKKSMLEESFFLLQHEQKKKLHSSWCVKSTLHFNKLALKKGTRVNKVFFNANFFHFKQNILKRRTCKLKKTVCFYGNDETLLNFRTEAFFFRLILLYKMSFCLTSSNSRT